MKLMGPCHLTNINLMISFPSMVAFILLFFSASAASLQMSCYNIICHSLQHLNNCIRILNNIKHFCNRIINYTNTNTAAVPYFHDNLLILFGTFDTLWYF